MVNATFAAVEKQTIVCTKYLQSVIAIHILCCRLALHSNKYQDLIT